MPDNSIPVIDHPLAPEIFAGGGACFGLIGTTAVVVTLTSPRWNPEDDTAAQHVVARIVLPLHRAQTLVLGLNAFLEKHGHKPANLVRNGLVKQSRAPTFLGRMNNHQTPEHLDLGLRRAPAVRTIRRLIPLP
jgi:hypothetical protein